MYKQYKDVNDMHSSREERESVSVKLVFDFWVAARKLSTLTQTINKGAKAEKKKIPK